MPDDNMKKNRVLDLQGYIQQLEKLHDLRYRGTVLSDLTHQMGCGGLNRYGLIDSRAWNA